MTASILAWVLQGISGLPPDSFCRREYSVAHEMLMVAETPMKKEHARQMRDFWYAAWNATDREGGPGFRAAWATKAKAIIGEDSWARARWPYTGKERPR